MAWKEARETKRVEQERSSVEHSEHIAVRCRRKGDAEEGSMSRSPLPHKSPLASRNPPAQYKSPPVHLPRAGPALNPKVPLNALPAVPSSPACTVGVAVPTTCTTWPQALAPFLFNPIMVMQHLFLHLRVSLSPTITLHRCSRSVWQVEAMSSLQ